MQVLPYWIQVLQAFGTPAIALLAIVIGVMQWRTAHQRAVLDLFDKRFALYQELRTVIAQVLAQGHVGMDTTMDFLRATDKAQFLFGPEVTAYLNSVYKLLSAHGEAEDMMKVEGPEHQEWVKKIRRFQRDQSILCAESAADPTIHADSPEGTLVLIPSR